MLTRRARLKPSNRDTHIPLANSLSEQPLFHPPSRKTERRSSREHLCSASARMALGHVGTHGSSCGPGSAGREGVQAASPSCLALRSMGPGPGAVAVPGPAVEFLESTQPSGLLSAGGNHGVSSFVGHERERSERVAV